MLTQLRFYLEISKKGNLEEQHQKAYLLSTD